MSSSKTLISKVPIQVPGAGSMLPQRISQHTNVAFSGGEPFETYVTRMDAVGQATRVPATHYVDGDISVRVTWDTTAAKSLVNDKAGAGQSALESLHLLAAWSTPTTLPAVPRWAQLHCQQYQRAI